MAGSSGFLATFTPSVSMANKQINSILNQNGRMTSSSLEFPALSLEGRTLRPSPLNLILLSLVGSHQAHMRDFLNRKKARSYNRPGRGLGLKGGASFLLGVGVLK